MSLYTVKVFKDGRFVREWQVECAAGGDPDDVFVNPDGSEEMITWTEQEACSHFEFDLEGAMVMWSACRPVDAIAGEAGDPGAARP
jgi:hypothetical protein